MTTSRLFSTLQYNDVAIYFLSLQQTKEDKDTMRPLYDRYRLVKKHIASREANKSLQQDKSMTTTADSKYWLVATTWNVHCSNVHMTISCVLTEIEFLM